MYHLEISMRGKRLEAGIPLSEYGITYAHPFPPTVSLLRSVLWIDMSPLQGRYEHHRPHSLPTEY